MSPKDWKLGRIKNTIGILLHIICPKVEPIGWSIGKQLK